MSGARFIGEYPFARIEFIEDSLPLKVSLEAFNPFIPLNSRDSGLPVAIFYFTLENPTDGPVESTLAASLLNPIGYDPGSPLANEYQVQNRRFRYFGSNVNELVQEEEGLAIVKGVRDRYDGEKRNPWDEVECGHHYARAMSSWSLLLALSGYEYSAPDMRLGFDPRMTLEHFRSLFTTGSAWGVFSQELRDGQLEMKVQVIHGELNLREFQGTVPNGFQEKVTGVQVRKMGKDDRMQCETSFQKDSGRFGNTRVVVDFGKPVCIRKGEQVLVILDVVPR